MRNVLSIVPRASQDMVAAVIRISFAQPDAKHIQTQFDEVTRMLERTRPEVAAMLHDARDSKGVIPFPSSLLHNQSS